jgi:hypothetical protein
MRINTCPNCGCDISAVPMKKRLFAQFQMKVVRCPRCKQRRTFLKRREFIKVLAK